MAKRKGPERSKYPKFKWSFDYFYKNNGNSSKYHKDADTGWGGLPYDAQLIYKGKYYGIEYKACTNKAKFTFSAMKDLEKEVSHLKHVEACGGTGWVVVLFPKVTKLFTPAFVIKNFDKQLKIEECGKILPEIKDGTNRTIWDVTVLLGE